MILPDGIRTTDKPERAIVLAFAKGDHLGQGLERMMIAHTTEDSRLKLCDTEVADDETPDEAALRCANASLWMLHASDERLREEDLKPLGVLETVERRMHLFQVGFLMDHRFVKDISGKVYVPLEQVTDFWERFVPESHDILVSLPQIVLLHKRTVSFFTGKADAHA